MRSAFLAVLVAAFLTGVAGAQDRADVVTLKNGDRITGTVTGITATSVIVDTAAAGTLEFAIGEVADVTTGAPVQLATDGGEKFAGTVTGLADGQLQVATGGATRSVAIGELVTYRPPVEWEGSIHLGGSITTGNTERRAANAQGEAIRRTDDTRLTLRATWDYGQDKDEATGEWDLTQRRTFGSAKGDYFLTDELYLWGQVSAENDLFADLKLRLTSGAGLGYLLVTEATFSLQAEAGLSYVDENRYASADSSYLAARAAYALRWDITPHTQLLQDAEVYPSLEDADDVYARLDTRLRTSLTESMFAQLQHVLDYDNTPSPGNDRDDHRLIAAVGWTF